MNDRIMTPGEQSEWMQRFLTTPTEPHVYTAEDLRRDLDAMLAAEYEPYEPQPIHPLEYARLMKVDTEKDPE